MHRFLGDASAAEDMEPVGVNDLPTHASGAAGGGEEFQMELHFEIDEEEVIRSSVCWYASAHSQDWVGARAEQDFAERVA